MNAPARNLGSLSVARNLGSANAPAAAAVPIVSSSFKDVDSSVLASWGIPILIVVVLIVLFAVYYKTIGYYINLGWEKLKWSHDRGEKIEIKVPGSDITATMKPTKSDDDSLGSDVERGFKKIESDVESALGFGGSSKSGGKQVFNVSRNLYKFSDAEPLCRAYGAELATYDQVKDAYKAGADWCNYGWSKGQLALYPTQKSTYEKLQHGPEHERMSCGLPGVNGGYFPNEEQRFGVNCYGPRPAESALDERVQMEERSDTAFDREVNHYKAELDSIAVNPFSSKQWSA